MSISKCGGHGTLSGWRRTISSRFRRQWCSQSVGVRKGKARALAGTVRQWVGPTASASVRRIDMEITDTSAGSLSPYAKLARQGAVIVPRGLFFVNEVDNPASIHQSGTITTIPRRGAYDKEPWKSLDLRDLDTRTVEADHVYDVHLGETVGTVFDARAVARYFAVKCLV